MNKNHWLMRAKKQAGREGLPANVATYFQRGSVAWRNFTNFDSEEQEKSAISRAQREGYLSTNTGIPYLLESI